MFTWSVIFIIIFGLLLASYGIDVGELSINFDYLLSEPIPPNISIFSPLGFISYGIYFAYFFVSKVLVIIAFFVNLMTFGANIGTIFNLPIIPVIMFICLIFITYEAVKLIAGFVSGMASK